ncbi:MAG: tail fiber domain-containing protein [Candidatus Korobacteraceae bacterium]
MRSLIISTLSAIFLFASVCGGQQITSNATAQRPRNETAAPPPGPVIGGDGTPNYLAIWARSNYLLSSAIYQSGSKIGIGTTTPAVTLDVSGTVNATTYNLTGFSVLSAPYQNLFVGIGAGASGAGGGTNTFVGNGAGANVVDGQQNTFVGYDAGGASSNSASFNSFFGWRAGYFTTVGLNAFFGYEAGYGNTTGSGNSFFGASAGVQNGAGDSNSFFGYDTGLENTQGSNDVFLGYNAGGQNITGSGNTFVGMSAGARNTTGSNDIYINNSGPSSGNESNAIRIGNSSLQSAAYIAGIYGTTSSGGVPVYVNSNGQLGTQPSSLRFKEQIRDMGDSTSALMRLRPVTFFYKPEYDKGERTLQYGLIAEEVARIYPELVAYDNDGQPYSVRYQYLSTMLLNEVQKQYRRAEAQAGVIKTQEKKIDELEQRLSRLEALIRTQVSALRTHDPGDVGTR